MSDLRPHPVAECFPPLTEQEYSDLLEDIRENGVRIPIVVTGDGQIVDGVHRHRACWEAHSKEPPISRLAPDADAWMAGIKLNLARRHLDESQRSMVAHRLSKESVAHRPKKSDNCPTSLTQTQAAAVMNVNEKSVRRARKVEEKGSAKLIAAVDRGKEHGVAVSDAAAIVSQPKAVQNQALALVEAGEEKTLKAAAKKVERKKKVDKAKAAAAKVKPSERWEVHHLPVAELSVQVEAGSVDIVITDPPYHEKHIGLFGEAARFAAHALRDGGSLLLMCGGKHQPEIYKELDGCGLNYQWELAYKMPGAASPVHPRNISQMWKPVIWMVKGSYDKQARYIRSMVEGRLAGEDINEFHEWGQTEAGGEALLYQFLKSDKAAYPGGVVCDPMSGGGGFGVAALRLKAGKFIGADIDAESVAITTGRLADAARN